MADVLSALIDKKKKQSFVDPAEELRASLEASAQQEPSRVPAEKQFSVKKYEQQKPFFEKEQALIRQKLEEAEREKLKFGSREQLESLGKEDKPKGSSAMIEALRKMDEIAQQNEQKKQGVQAAYETSISDALTELKKKKEVDMTPGEIIAKSLLALAPLLGYAVKTKAGGPSYLTGAAIGEASQTALKKIDDVLKSEREAQVSSAEQALKVQLEQRKEALSPYKDMEKLLASKQLDLALLPAKTQEQISQFLAQEFAKAGIQAPKVAGEAKESTAEALRKLKEQEFGRAMVPVATPKAPKTPEESDLGFGFRMKGTNWTSKMRETSAKAVSALGEYHNAIDNLKQTIENAGLSGVTKWTEAGQSVDQALALFKEASRRYYGSGAGFTESEQKAAMQSGFDLRDPAKMAQMAFDPKIAARFLDRLKSFSRSGIAARIIPFGAEDTQAVVKKSKTQDQEIADPKRAAINKIISSGRAKEFQQATPQRRAEMLNEVMGK